MSTQAIRVVGISDSQLKTFWQTGVDHAGNTAEPFADEQGGWPLRCCLRDSRTGEELAIVAWSPFPWAGPYAETGPIVVHTQPCRPHPDDRLPAQFHDRRQVLRPYSTDRRIAYDHIRVVQPYDDLDADVAALLARDDIAFVHARNVLSGCYSFTVERR